MSAEALENKPIIFGDFMKMGADPADRIYEDLTDLNKLKNILNDVSRDSTVEYRLNGSKFPPMLILTQLPASYHVHW